MKKVLGIVGSKRKLGNCEILVKEISRRIEIPHELQLLRLPDFNIRYCNACYRCLIKEDGCVLKDVLNTVLQAIAEADALIVAVPTYVLGAHACLKMFLDRGLAFYKVSERLWDKPAVGIGIAGIEGKEGSTLLDIERFFHIMRAEMKMGRILYAALPGEIAAREENRRAAGELAKALFSPGHEEKIPCCPACGGQTFRFLDSKTIRCMLCSNTGTIDLRGEKPNICISRGEHDLGADNMEHRDWLIGMKERYWDRKEDLQKIKADYVEEGHWIKPS